VPAFPKPTVRYDYDVDTELRALRDYPKLPDREDRTIPPKAKDRLLLATWNIANLGLQKRREKDHRLLAEMLGWFDLVAIQEVNDNLEGLRAVQAELPKRYRVVFSDPGGNNVHLYFGDEDDEAGMDRRCLEAYAVGRWASLRRKNAEAYTRNVLALGDFNLPVRTESDPVYRALDPERPAAAGALDESGRIEPQRRRALRPDGGLPGRDGGRDHRHGHLRLRRGRLSRPLGHDEGAADEISAPTSSTTSPITAPCGPRSTPRPCRPASSRSQPNVSALTQGA
jgi:hypothetical protein